MQAVILAGGYGKRLGNITKSVPKPMVDICGKPFLQYQLEYLRNYGVTDILLLVSYLASVVENFFGDGGEFGLNIRYSYEDKPLGTGGALKLAEDMLKERFILLNGDTFLPVNYDSFLRVFENSRCLALLAVCSDRGGKIGVVPNIKVDDEGAFSAYDKNGGEEFSYIDAGLAGLKKEVMKFFPKGKVVSVEEVLYSNIVPDIYVCEERFYDIGLPERLEEFKGVVGSDYFKDTV